MRTDIGKCRVHRAMRTLMPLATAVVFACAGGCDEPPTGDDAAVTESGPIVKEADRGAVTLTVTAARGRISIAERLELMIAVEAEPDLSVRMPRFGEALNDFQIRDFQSDPVEDRPDGRRKYVQRYDLDIFLSGTYSIPGVTIQYREQTGESGSGETDAAWASAATLSTDPISIEVTSLLDGEFDPKKFRDVKPVAELRPDASAGWFMWIGIALGAVIVVVGLLWLGGRRLIRGRTVPVMPPHEWAFQQLQALAAAKWIEAGRVRDFYYRLNEIVRTYIELRFSLMAPERTTEEFLEEMRSSSALPESFQPSLADFLAACDMVKYARYAPGAEEIERVFNAARDFVEQTRSAAPRVSEEVAV